MEYVQAVDDGALVWLGNHHQPWLTAVMKAFTFLGDKWTLLVLVALAAALFYRWGRRRTAVIVLLGALLGVGISQGCKYVLKRARPDVSWRLVEPERTPSLPSGHSLLSMAILGGIALTLSRTLPRRGVRWLVIALGLGLPLLVGVSRPYLGVHYPSDVLAGWTMGLACALLTFWTDRRWGDQPRLVLPALRPAPTVTLTPPPPASDGAKNIEKVKRARGRASFIPRYGRGF